ncbi:MAG: hypothetical protein RQ754_13925 [Desulfuromonadales bacterium]|nr:hypothetical protein [Desulfuromonadales bacterium]
MKNMFFVLAVLLVVWVPSAFAEEPAVNADFIEFQKLLDTQCSKCHTRARIEQAMAEGRAFPPIAERMADHGAVLNDRERDVMGVFWMENSPQPATPVMPLLKDDPLGEYRAVIQSRCTGCHDLARIEQALSENRSFETLAKMMLERGAVLTEADYKVLGTFWGEPLK